MRRSRGRPFRGRSRRPQGGHGGHGGHHGHAPSPFVSSVALEMKGGYVLPHAVEFPETGELVCGMLELQGDGSGFLRYRAHNYLPSPADVFVPGGITRRYGLRDGAEIEGPVGPPRRPGQRPILRDVARVDGMEPALAARLPQFKGLTSIDPDFHYELGDVPLEDGSDKGDASLRILDLLTPIGRGQRALVVSPPRAGKTILLMKIAKAMERKYPDVQLMVLLVDERPEEGTYWRRSTRGEVYLSTLDLPPRNHVMVAEAVWKRARRLVECGKEVILLLDSITRLARAYNHEVNTGRTMSGGIDSKTMERPKQFFGSARNTEEGGSLTIVGTALVDTGSRMDQVIYEEFKGTGNMELVLSRALADRRIFPAFDIPLSGTRKEEKLLSAARLRKVVTLRRVLQRMKPIEAMELLVKKVEDTPSNEDFLKAFEISSLE